METSGADFLKFIYFIAIFLKNLSRLMLYTQWVCGTAEESRA